jgi:hypothetical protein
MTLREGFRPLLYLFAVVSPIFFCVALLRLFEGHLYGGWVLVHLAWPALLWLWVYRDRVRLRTARP